MRWLAWMALLLWPAVAAGQNVEPPSEVVLDADASVPVWINGLEVALAVSTGTVDHVTLNDDIVRRIGLSGVPSDRTADLVIGGRVTLQGRHGAGWLAHGGHLQRQEIYWFPGESRLALAGTIGPFALPYWRVKLQWPVAAQREPEMVSLPLIGSINRAAYGVMPMGKTVLLVGVDVRNHRPLPLVTAAMGADLAAQLGGRFVGEPFQEEILLGVRRPLRRLQLDRPLMIGPIRIDAVAVRTGGPRDATMSLERGQVAPFDAEEDPDIMQVRGRIIKRRNAARYIMLSRTQLEAHGCASLLIDKAQQRWELTCAAPTPPPRPNAAWAQFARVPVASPPVLVNDVLPPAAPVQLALDGPVQMAVGGQYLDLALGDGGQGGLLLNRRAVNRVARERVSSLANDPAMLARMEGLRNWLEQSGGVPGVNPGALQEGLVEVLPRIPGSEDRRIAPNTYLTSLDVTASLAGRRAELGASWIEARTPSGNTVRNPGPRDGTVALAALPAPWLRLRLADAPPAGTEATLSLSIADRSHDQAVMGVAAVPGISPLFIGLDLGDAQPDPIASMALGEDLIRLHGGVYDETRVRQRMADYRVRSLRRLQLAKPLVIGPLRIDAVLVEQVPTVRGLLARNRQRFGHSGYGQWPAHVPWPDVAGFAGLERELRLTRVQLRAAGCHELEIDKPGRSWTLRCGASSTGS